MPEQLSHNSRQARMSGRTDEVAGTDQRALEHPSRPCQCAFAVKRNLLLSLFKQLLTCSIDSSAPTKIDLLTLSPGYLSTAGRTPTPEGLDHITSIRYHARMLFTVSLLPLLRLAPSPRVISVLAGGKEGQLWPDDFLLEQHYSLGNAAGAAASMLTLFMEELSKREENVKVVFVHLFPGLVTDTQNLPQAEHWSWVMRMLMAWVVLPLLRPFGRVSADAGERVLFAGTDGRFDRGSKEKGSDGRVGSGVYLAQGDSSVMEAAPVAEKMRKEGVGEKLYVHTMGVFDAVK